MPDIRYWCNTCKKVIESLEVEGHPHDLDEWGGQGRKIPPVPKRTLKKEQRVEGTVELQPPNRVRARFRALLRDWETELEAIARAYTEAYGGFASVQSVPDNIERVSKSDVSRPAESAALDWRRRERAGYALWKVEQVTEQLKAIRGQMESSIGPINLSALGELPADPRQGVYKLGSRKAKSQQRHFQRIQAKRRVGE